MLYQLVGTQGEGRSPEIFSSMVNFDVVLSHLGPSRLGICGAERGKFIRSDLSPVTQNCQ